jgi:hypothetical protein
VSIELLQAKLDQKLKLLQDRKKLIRNLKNLELVEKEVQQEIDKILPEKRKFEEWARYFGDDIKSKQVLLWFGDEIRKHQVKIERVISMREKILVVQEKIDLQLNRLNTDIEQLRGLLKNVPRNLAAATLPGESPYDVEMETEGIFAADDTLKPGREPEIFTHTREIPSVFRRESDKIPTPSEITPADTAGFDSVINDGAVNQTNPAIRTGASSSQHGEKEILRGATTTTQFFRTTRIEEKSTQIEATPVIPDKTEPLTGVHAHSKLPPLPASNVETISPLLNASPISPDREFTAGVASQSNEPLPVRKPEPEHVPATPIPTSIADQPTIPAPALHQNWPRNIAPAESKIANQAQPLSEQSPAPAKGMTLIPRDVEKPTFSNQASSTIFGSKDQASIGPEQFKKATATPTAQIPIQTEFDEFLSFEQKSKVSKETVTRSNEVENLFKYISEQPIRTASTEMSRGSEQVELPVAETTAAGSAPSTGPATSRTTSAAFPRP